VFVLGSLVAAVGALFVVFSTRVAYAYNALCSVGCWVPCATLATVGGRDAEVATHIFGDSNRRR
jgi:hypothetical protein